jgi:iron complex outermembrane recepter protein
MTGEVGLSATVAANVILRYVENVGPGTPTQSRLSTTSGPLKWRGRASVGATYRGFTTTLFGNYLGGFTNDENRSPATGALITPVELPSYTTFDLNLGYATTFEGREKGVLKGLRGSVTVLNLFDRDPQSVVTGFGSYLAGRGSPFGRTVSFQLTGSF